ncbi:hypothetical protein [Vibrio crassostreae]|uniref:hypothetical protein n=1 Tax=Vibrio crassostreae TaxID=246167 RepID=UPI001B306B40|nr:hypothetical protein [Vibrio crassostreae]
MFSLPYECKISDDLILSDELIFEICFAKENPTVRDTTTRNKEGEVKKSRHTKLFLKSSSGEERTFHSVDKLPVKKGEMVSVCYHKVRGTDNLKPLYIYMHNSKETNRVGIEEEFQYIADMMSITIEEIFKAYRFQEKILSFFCVVGLIFCAFLFLATNLPWWANIVTAFISIVFSAYGVGELMKKSNSSTYGITERFQDELSDKVIAQFKEIDEQLSAQQESAA